MEILIQIAQLILCLSILVTLHEFGHFITAKWFNVQVDKFYLFFDVPIGRGNKKKEESDEENKKRGWSGKLWKTQKDETEYGIGWLPMGGYVKLGGMIDESMDDDWEKVPVEKRFDSKPAWQRLIIMSAGIIVNFFLAWFIYTMILTFAGDNYTSMDKMQENGLIFSEASKQAGFEDGDKIVRVNGKKQPNANWMVVDILLADSVTVDRNGKEVNLNIDDNGIKSIMNGAKKQGLFSPMLVDVVVDSVQPDSHAQKAGLLKGDKIVGVNQNALRNFSDFKKEMNNHKKDSIIFNIERNGVNVKVPAYVSDSATVGFMYKGLDAKKLDAMKVSKKFNFFQAIPEGFNKTITNLTYQIKQFKLIIRPKTEAYKQVSGPLRLFKVFAPEWDWLRFWSFTAMFSVWLAFVNFLPIPALDGGHIMFTLIEMISGRKLGVNFMKVMQIIGFVFLVGLMVLIFGNDIYHLIMDK